jgi:hypothetical protein
MQPIVELFCRMINSDLEKEVLRFCAEAGFEIDKKRLVQALEDARAFFDEGYAEGYTAGKEAAAQHGRWEKRDGKTWCSLCGASNKAYEPPYCPHCGVKMDGGVSNEGEAPQYVRYWLRELQVQHLQE